MSDLSLTGKVAIITGSGRETGIGAGIALTLARNGAWVVINHISDESAPRAAKVAESIVQNTIGKVIVVQADVSTPEGAKVLVEESLRQFKVDHVDILGTDASFFYILFHANNIPIQSTTQQTAVRDLFSLPPLPRWKPYSNPSSSHPCT